MRPIKFRAWDKKLKEMVHIDTIFFTSECVLEQLSCTTIGHEANYSYSLYENFEVIQFTGLLDKNDKEIYCSDLLKIFYGSVPDEYCIYEIKWNAYQWDLVKHGEARFNGDTIRGDFKMNSFLWREYDKSEIIGNIYENPE